VEKGAVVLESQRKKRKRCATPKSGLLLHPMRGGKKGRKQRIEIDSKLREPQVKREKSNPGLR